MRWRPSILLAITVLGVVSLVSLLLDADAAIVTGCTGGVIALGMRLLEGSDGKTG